MSRVITGVSLRNFWILPGKFFIKSCATGGRALFFYWQSEAVSRSGEFGMKINRGECYVI